MVGDPHQQIYGFRGAINAMEMVRSTRTFFLTQVDCDPSRTLTGGCIGSSVVYYFASRCKFQPYDCVIIRFVE